MATRPLDEKLASMDGMRTRSKPKLSLVPGGKGRPPLRQCPADFDVIFVEVGRLDCETYYRAARITIDRWLVERGKERLLKERTQFVTHQRAKARKAKPIPPQDKPIKDRRKISDCLAQAAVDWLRKPRHGGWIITRCVNGNYRAGFLLVSAATLVDMAKARGFDAKLAKATCDISERFER